MATDADPPDNVIPFPLERRLAPSSAPADAPPTWEPSEPPAPGLSRWRRLDLAARERGMPGLVEHLARLHGLELAERYRIEGLHRIGSQFAVFEGCELDGGPVAVKLPLLDYGRPASFGLARIRAGRRTAEREWDTLQGLAGTDHPFPAALALVLEKNPLLAGRGAQAEEETFLVEEWVAGESLDDLRQRLAAGDRAAASLAVTSVARALPSLAGRPVVEQPVQELRVLAELGDGLLALRRVVRRLHLPQDVLRRLPRLLPDLGAPLPVQDPLDRQVLDLQRRHARHALGLEADGVVQQDGLDLDARELLDPHALRRRELHLHLAGQPGPARELLRRDAQPGRLLLLVGGHQLLQPGHLRRHELGELLDLLGVPGLLELRRQHPQGSLLLLELLLGHRRLFRHRRLVRHSAPPRGLRRGS